MATPTVSTSLATLRPELGASLMVFDLAMSQSGFIGQKVMPVLDVDKAAGPFGKINIEAVLQKRNTLRTSRGAYARQDWEFTTDFYATQEHGVEEKVDDRDRNLYGSYFKAEQVAALRARDAVLRDYEARVAGQVFNITTYTGSNLTSQVSTPWTNHAASVPISDVAAGKGQVYNGLGLRANTIIFNYNRFLDLQQNADLINRIKFSGLENPDTEDIVASALGQAFGVDNVLIAGAQQNGANEGQPATLAPLWSGAFCWIGYVAQTDDIQEPCVGRTFHWDGDGSQIGGTMESYRDEHVRADIVRCRHETEEKMLVPAAGYLLTNVGPSVG